MVILDGGGGAITIGVVVAAPPSFAGAGMEVFTGGGATTAPASFNAGDEEGEGMEASVKMEVEVGSAYTTFGALVGATTILGATTAGASAGSWTWPSLI